MFQPIHIIRIDERTQNMFILAGHQENIEIVITPDGEVSILMKQTNYANMNDQELKQYLLDHKDNQEAFYAYLDRKQQHPKRVIIKVNELETLTTEQKIELLTQRLQERFKNI